MAGEENVKASDWKALREIPVNTESFVANGKEYRVHKSVSFDRWEAYEILQVEIGLARSYQQLMDGLREAYDLCNQVAAGKPVFADLAVGLRDMIIGTTLVGEKQTPAVLKMAALFINREGEDVRFIDEATIESKIEDWRIEGISMTFFFQFALHSIPGFFAAFKAISHGTLSKRATESGADKVEGTLRHGSKS
jgi:hypothetical protein